MSDIPADLLEKANSLLDYIVATDDCDMLLTIARALMEERERCAKIAEDKTRSICRGDYVLIGPRGVGMSIATAIRKGTPE